MAPKQTQHVHGRSTITLGGSDTSIKRPLLASPPAADAVVLEYTFALDVLLRKLRASQPAYFDEDVVHPQAELSNSSIVNSIPTAVEHQHQHQLHTLVSGHQHIEGGRKEVRGSPTQQNGGDFPSAGGKELKSVMEVAEQLDLSQLGRSRRCLMELLKLLQRAITFVLDHCGRERSSSSSNGLSPEVSTARRSAEVTMGREGNLDTTPSRAPRGNFIEALKTLAGESLPLAIQRCVLLLDEVVQSLLVYANDSEHLRSALRYDRELVAGMCGVCLAARRLELRGASSGGIMQTCEDSPRLSTSNRSGRSSARMLSKQDHAFPAQNQTANHMFTTTLRDVSEVKSLQEWLQVEHVGQALSKSIADVFALEMLMDGALPPAVCSSRFDGMTGLIWECKATLVGEILAARGFLSSWMKKATPFQVLRMSIMGLYAPPRSRAKLYDKMTAEGLLTTVHEQVHAAVSECKRWCPVQEAQPTQERNFEAVCVLHDCLDLLLCVTAPTGDDHGPQAPSPSPIVAVNEKAPMESIPAQETPTGRAPSRGATAPAALRGGAWATHIGELRRICFELVSVANIVHVPQAIPLSTGGATSDDDDSIASSRTSSASQLGQRQQSSAGHPLQRLRRPGWVTAALMDKICECVFQVARGSRELLHMVIHDVIDKLFDSVACHAAGLLLPLLLNVVDAVQKSGESTTTSAEDSDRIDLMADWFSTALCVDFVPWMFAHRRPWTLGRIISTISNSLTGGTRSSHGLGPPSSVGHVSLVRHIRRDEETLVVRYLDFGKRLVRDTAWREGTSGFLQKVLVVAKSVWAQQAIRPPHRRTLIAGLAAECIHVLTPIVEPCQREPSLLQTLLRTDSVKGKRQRSEESLPPIRSPPPPQRPPPAILGATMSPLVQEVVLPSPAELKSMDASPQSPAPRALLSEFETTTQQSPVEMTSRWQHRTTSGASRRQTF